MRMISAHPKRMLEHHEALHDVGPARLDAADMQWTQGVERVRNTTFARVSPRSRFARGRVSSSRESRCSFWTCIYVTFMVHGPMFSNAFR